MGSILARDGDYRRSWHAQTIDSKGEWYYPLSEDCLRVLGRFAKRVEAQPTATAQLPVDTDDLTACQECLEAVQEALLAGRGFAIVQQLPTATASQQELTAMYWALGHLLGTPQVQDKHGTLSFDVTDTGQDVKQGARFSVTNSESGYHTDCAFNPGMPEMVGLLCLKTAKSGGRSQLVSAYTIHDELASHFPVELETLYRPFHFDRRGQHGDDEPPTLPFPIFAAPDNRLRTRYMRYYIQVGQERIGKPLSETQASALSAMEDTIHQSGMKIEFDLQPGQMLFTSNRWILHNRTSFEDHEDPERRRHYVRLWLNK
jgi:alpha-ketoglutarate-dependent taurine dioxygenase